MKKTKNKSEKTFECKYCGKEKPVDALEDEFEKGRICKDCFVPRVKSIINDLKVFCDSDDFRNLNRLISKKIWLSAEMGFWHDVSGPNVQYQEGVADYLKMPIEDIQSALLGEIKTLISRLNRDGSRLDDKWINEKLNLYKKFQ